MCSSDLVAKRNVRAAIERVAERLGNTPTICRKCYVHPEILGCYLEGELLLQVKDEVEAALRDDIASLRPEETAVLALLQARLATAKETERPAAQAGRSRKSGAQPARTVRRAA